MKTKVAVLAGLFFLGACQAQYSLGNNWVQDLMSNINRMTLDLHANIEQIQARLQQDLQKQLGEIQELSKKLESLNGTSTISDTVMSTIGDTVIVNGSNGASRIIIVSRDSNGNPYIRNVEEFRDKNTLYHNEKIYNPETNKTETIRWKLDLSTPDAKPEIITDN